MLELIKEIKSRNIKTTAWVAEDPKNRWQVYTQRTKPIGLREVSLP